MQTLKIKITGMTCHHCVARVEKALKAVPGVKTVQVSLDTGATVQHENASEDQLLQAIQKAGDYRGQIIP